MAATQSAKVRHTDPPELTSAISPAMSLGASESARTAANAMRLTQSKALAAKSPGGSNGAAWIGRFGLGCQSDDLVAQIGVETGDSLRRRRTAHGVVHHHRFQSARVEFAERFQEAGAVVVARQHDCHLRTRIEELASLVREVDVASGEGDRFGDRDGTVRDRRPHAVGEIAPVGVVDVDDRGLQRAGLVGDVGDRMCLE